MADISSEAINELIFDLFSSISDFQITTMDDLATKVVLVDDRYSPITRNVLLAIAKDNPLKAPPGAPKTPITDCDDYALQLKAMATAQFRQRYFEGTAAPLPPAVAIVLSQNHAVNLFVEQDAQGNNSICFIDAGSPDLPIISGPAQAAQIMKEPPVKLIYM